MGISKPRTYASHGNEKRMTTFSFTDISVPQLATGVNIISDMIGLQCNGIPGTKEGIASDSDLAYC